MIFFRRRLEQIIDLNHPLAVLADKIPRQEIRYRWLIARLVDRAKPFVVPVAGGGVDCFISEISRNCRPQATAKIRVTLALV